jgi:hypothetical protein
MMMMRSVLHHAAGIASAGLTIVLLLAAYVLQEQGLAFPLVIIAFVPGY